MNFKESFKSITNEVSSCFSATEVNPALQNSNNMVGLVNGVLTIYLTVQMIKANKQQQKMMEEAQRNAQHQ